MAVSTEIMDEILKGCSSLADVSSLHTELLQRMINRSLEAEMEAHLGYARHQKTEREESGSNSRNGHTRKTIQSAHGDLTIETPRDREGSFTPQLVAKRQLRLGGMEDKIIALYAKGMTTRDIEEALVDLYGVNLSHDVISHITEAILEEARLWQSRPLDAIYPIVWLDGIVIKVQQNKQVINKSVHIVFGVNLEGKKEVLGLWITENEGAKFWLSVLTELKHRGVQDIYIACMDGLTGLPGAVQSVFPKTLTQLCIVHLVRASLRYVSWKDHKMVAAGLKRIYQSASEEEAAEELAALEKQWGEKYPSVVRVWRDNWDNIIPFFQFVPQIRKVIYTTNAIESLNMTIRKFTRNRRIFPNDDAAFKGVFVAIREASKNWNTIMNWKPAMQTFQIMFGTDRVPLATL